MYYDDIELQIIDYSINTSFVSNVRIMLFIMVYTDTY